MGEHITFCRICEAECGLVASVEDGRVTRLRPDPAHPLSRGHACPKGIAFAEVQNDPDRVLHPLRRQPDGSFARAGWEEALDDIAARLRPLPGDAVGWYMGNPGAFSYSHVLWAKGLLDALGSRHWYTAGSQDINNRFAASALLYGTPLLVPFPDVHRTSLLVIIGANPLVSHGSALTLPRIREALGAVPRVVVVDPRRTETARAFEHVPVLPDTDAWLLLSLLHVLFEEDLTDVAAIARMADGAEELRAAAAEHPPEATASRTRVPATTVRALARDLAAAESAAVYGRTGSCLGRFGTLVAFLIDAVNLVTGNLDRPGGAVVGRPAIALDDVGARAGIDTYGAVRSRIGDFPDVIGNLPASLLPAEITTPGKGRLRALFVSAGNPVLSVPDGDAMERALGELDLLVGIDLYVNDTNKHADWILPATTFLEREDLPIQFFGFHATPFVQFTDPVVAPAGEARQEWEIIEDLSRRLGVVPSSLPWLRRLRLRVRPQRLADVLLRIGPDGDRFGLRRRGLSLRWLRRHPSGVVTAAEVATGVLRGRLRTGRRRRVQLAPPAIAGELRRLAELPPADPAFPLRLIGLRELRSHNSWMHNADGLMRGRSFAARMHPADAEELGVGDGGTIRIASRSGAIEVPVRLTDEVVRGVLAVPHGWGHRGGGWRRANAAGGANVNLLASGAPEDLEPLAGMAFLNGIPVAVTPVASAEPGARAAAARDDAGTAETAAARAAATSAR